jgi:hypothetical protein
LRGIAKHFGRDSAVVSAGGESMGDVEQRQKVFDVSMSHKGESYPEQKIER